MYLFITVAGAAFENCPYQTPGSHILRYLGPKAWRGICSVSPNVGPTLRNLLEESKVISTIALSAKAHDPWWSRSQIIPFFGRLVLKVPLGFVVDVYHLGRATIRVSSALPFGAYHWVFPFDTDFRGLPSYHTITMIRALVHYPRNLLQCN